MNKNKYEEIINGNETFQKIAKELLSYGRCIIGWTDEGYDHRDILFTYRPHKYGNLQRGLRWTYLFVSIIDVTSMGFLIEDNADNTKDPNYIMEKLRLYDNSCNNKICELINSVIKYIDILRRDEKYE